MCNYKILHQCEKGCVVKCNDCDCIKVVFGTMSISLTQNQFYEFMEIVSEYLERHKNEEEFCRCISIPTSVRAIQLFYCLNDLKQLSAILDEAYLSLEVGKLVTP